MIYLTAYFIALILLLIILFYTKVTITVRIKRAKEDDLTHINVVAWGRLIRLYFQLKTIDLSNFTSTQLEVEEGSPNRRFNLTKEIISLHRIIHIQYKIYKKLSRIYRLHRILISFLKRIYVKEFSWRTVLGTGDASATGSLTGVAWGFKSFISGTLSCYLSFKCLPVFSVHPDFNKEIFETELQCMIKLRVGDAIITSLRLVKNLGERRESKWQSTQFRA
jgi:hypothetical protein